VPRADSPRCVSKGSIPPAPGKLEPKETPEQLQHNSKTTPKKLQKNSNPICTQTKTPTKTPILREPPKQTPQKLQKTPNKLQKNSNPICTQTKTPKKLQINSKTTPNKLQPLKNSK
jgi:hypothetical protein